MPMSHTKRGIEELKSLTNVLDHVGTAFAAAKHNDGKLTFTDLLKLDVGESLIKAVSEAKNANFKAAKEELKDLSTIEAVDLCEHFCEKILDLHKKLHD